MYDKRQGKNYRRGFSSRKDRQNKIRKKQIMNKLRTDAILQSLFNRSRPISKSINKTNPLQSISNHPIRKHRIIHSSSFNAIKTENNYYVVEHHTSTDSCSPKSMKTNTLPRVPILSVDELLWLYVNSKSLRKCVDSGKYMFINGLLILRTLKCLKVSSKGITLLKKQFLDDYCVQICALSDQDDYNAQQHGGVLSRKKVKTTYVFKNANLIESVPIEEWERLITTGSGGGLPTDDFGASLSQLMKERGITNDSLAEASGLSVKTISRLRNNQNTPSLQTVIAICIGLSLDPYLSMKLVRIAGYCIKGDKTGRAYSILLSCAFSTTINKANHFLSQLGEKKLTDSDFD